VFNSPRALHFPLYPGSLANTPAEKKPAHFLEDKMRTLHEYFEVNWNRNPYPVIEHLLRINKEPDGTFSFYIHPTNTDGVTTDFIATDKEVKARYTPE
jgi:hypothetical protein